MTVIAFRDGVLCADGLATNHGHVIETVATKIGKAGRVLFSTSGSAAYAQSFRDWMRGGAQYRPPAPPEHSAAVIYLPDNSLIAVTQDGLDHRKPVRFWADGSGSDYALGAMEMGATPYRAVEIAILWNRGCGGLIRTLRRDD